MITNNNLFTQSYTDLKNFIKNNISDPRNRFKANWIHASMPDINAKDFDGYPFIVIEIDVSEDNKNFDNSSEKIFNALISVFSNEPTEVDTIADSIYSNLKDETKLTDFQVKDLSNSPLSWDMDMKGKKILNRRIGIIAKKRI